MATLTKNNKKAGAAVDKTKVYALSDAIKMLKEATFAKFDETLELHIRLGVDPRQANQNVRGTAALPHGTGKTVRVLVLTTPDKEAAAREAGAEYVGLDDFIEKINGGWTDIDVIICSPDVMAKVGKLGRVLGPRGLMPNPKSGTVTPDVGSAVKEVKAGKIDFRVDKTGIVHAGVGKLSFDADKLTENATELLQTINKMKPTGAKGIYFRSIFLSSTMGPGIKVDKSSVTGI